MKYIKLTESGYFSEYVGDGLHEWDGNNYCTADALYRDGKAAEFRVVPLVASGQPLHDPSTQTLREATPELIGDDWVQQWEVIDLSAEDVAVNLAAAISANLVRIDADVDAIYGAAIGNRQAEYEEAERQAQAYADAAYTGTVPGMVASWATAKGWTATQAADDILAQATAWRGAQDQIRAQRLLRKEQARTAADAAALAGVMAQWAGFAALVRQQLGL